MAGDLVASETTSLIAAPDAVAPAEAAPPTPTAASDADRERTVDLLRDHWLAGRLTLDELEERVGAAFGARTVQELWHTVRGLPVAEAPTQPRSVETERSPAAGRGLDSFVTGVAGLCLLLGSFGLLFLVSLPLSACAWTLGRQARRRAAAGGYVRHSGLATAGEVLGVIGTVLACLLPAGCGAWVALA